MDLHKFKRDMGEGQDEKSEYYNILDKDSEISENQKRIPNNDLMRMGKRREDKNLQSFNFPLRAPGMGFIRKRAPGMEFVGKRAPGMEFVGKRAPGMEFVGKRSPGIKFMIKKAGMEFIGKRAPGMEFVGKRAPGMEFVGKRSSNVMENKQEEQRQKRPSLYLLDSLL